MSADDASAAIAMIYHVTPPRKPANSHEEVLNLARAAANARGRKAAKAVMDRYAPSFCKVSDEQFEPLSRDLWDLGGQV